MYINPKMSHHKGATVTYRCRNDKCEQEFDVYVGPRYDTKISGPPENCYPAEGGDLEPESCPFCGVEVSDSVYEQADDASGPDPDYERDRRIDDELTEYYKEQQQKGDDV